MIRYAEKERCHMISLPGHVLVMHEMFKNINGFTRYFDTLDKPWHIVTLTVDFNYVTKISIECLCLIFKYKTSNFVVFLAS